MTINFDKITSAKILFDDDPKGAVELTLKNGTLTNVEIKQISDEEKAERYVKKMKNDKDVSKVRHIISMEKDGTLDAYVKKNLIGTNKTIKPYVAEFKK